jgi:pyruvate dehydrogenase E1 component alpha subunit
LAFKMQKRPNVVACFFGEGATSEGAFHEAVNLGAIWDLPVVYACENNLYGASTHISKVMRAKSVAERCSGYRIPCRTVDGNDVVAVHDAARAAVAECRQGKGPVLLEMFTYRVTGHSRRDPCHYQPKDEREAWKRRDPIETLGCRLLQRGDITAEDIEQVRTRVSQGLTADIQTARREPEPTLADLTTDVYA